MDRVPGAVVPRTSTSAYNFSLRPEHLHTFEAQIGRQFTVADVNLTFYNTAYRDLIKKIQVATIATPTGVRKLNDEYSINARRSTIPGLELLARVNPTSHLDGTVGVSRLLSASEIIGQLDPAITPTVAVTAGAAEVEFLARYMANALIDYRLTSRRGCRRPQCHRYVAPIGAGRLPKRRCQRQPRRLKRGGVPSRTGLQILRFAAPLGCRLGGRLNGCWALETIQRQKCGWREDDVGAAHL